MRYSYFFLALTGLLFSCKPEEERLPGGPDIFVGSYDTATKYELKWSDSATPEIREGEWAFLEFRKLSEDSVGAGGTPESFFGECHISGRTISFPEYTFKTHFEEHRNVVCIWTFQSSYLDKNDVLEVPFTVTGTCENKVGADGAKVTMEGSGSFTLIKYNGDEALRQPRLSFKPTSISLDASGTKSESISLISTRDWRIESKSDWITLDKESGKASTEKQSITISAAQNTGSTRQGLVFFSIGYQGASLLVTQAGK